MVFLIIFEDAVDVMFFFECGKMIVDSCLLPDIEFFPEIFTEILTSLHRIYYCKHVRQFLVW